MNLEPGQVSTVESLAPGGEQIVGNVTLGRIESLTVTTRVTYHASATSGLRLNLYFTPDEENYDTTVYSCYDIDFTAAAEVQKTELVTVSALGNLRVAVENLDPAQSATAIKVWVTICWRQEELAKILAESRQDFAEFVKLYGDTVNKLQRSILELSGQVAASNNNLKTLLEKLTAEVAVMAALQRKWLGVESGW